MSESRVSRRAEQVQRREMAKRRKNRNRLIVLAIVVLILIPIPRPEGVWFLNGLLFRFFDFINSEFLPPNF